MIFHVAAIIVIIQGEEVAVQDNANAFEQTCVDALALEDVIHIGAVAVQLVCEPTHAAFLTAQLCLDFFTDVYRH